MRVCVVAEYYPRPDDPVSGVWAHRQALAARDAGCDVRVLALERPLPSARSLHAARALRPQRLVTELSANARRPRRTRLDGVEVEYVRFLAPPRERSYASWHRYARRPLARALAELERRWPIDVVHAHYAVPAGAAARAFAAPRRLPLVVSVHGGDLLAPLLQAPATRALVGRVLARADGVLCNSAAMRRSAALLAGRGDHMRVVHLGADVPEQTVTKRTQPTIVTVAHVIPRKRHLDVLAAVRRLRDCSWVVIGDGPELPRLRAAAADLGDRVQFLGELPPERVRAELASSHAMVLPSVDEAFGVAYIEALACGVPAVGVHGEGGPEEIAALTPALALAPRGDAEGLAQTIEQVLSDDGRLAEEGRAAARRHFSWQRCGEETLTAYRATAAR